MTRGKCVVFFEDNEKERVLLSTEFNGDMYPEGCGALALKAMAKIAEEELTPDELRKKFSEQIVLINTLGEYNYQDEDMTWEVDRVNVDGDMYQITEKDYFNKYFSDYLYIVNKTGHEITLLIHVKEENEKEAPKYISVKPNHIIVSSFYTYKFEAFIGKSALYGDYIYTKNALDELVFLGAPIPCSLKDITIPATVFETHEGPSIAKVVTEIGVGALNYLEVDTLKAKNIKRIQKCGHFDAKIGKIQLNENLIEDIADLPTMTEVIYVKEDV